MCVQLQKVISSKFVFFLCFWEKVLGIANVVSKYLQKSEIDLNQAGVLVQELIKKVEEYRSDEAFDVFFEASSALCIESEVEPKSSMPSARKPKRRNN